MMIAIRVQKFGGSEVMGRSVNLDIPSITESQVSLLKIVVFAMYFQVLL